jgi:hypothetical protein
VSAAPSAIDRDAAGRYALTGFLSICLHVLAALGLFLLGHCNLGQGGGQLGYLGFDGDSVSFEIAGPESTVVGTPQPSVASEGDGPDDPPEAAEPPPRETTSPDAIAVRERRRPRRAPETTPEETPPTMVIQPGGGTSSEITDPGRAAGLASEILRPGLGIGGDGLSDLPSIAAAARCPDPAAGTWRAMKYDPDQHHWVTFTLRIRRSGDALTGTILSRTWSGGPSDRRPPECRPFGSDITVRMPARGHFSGGEMVFESSSYQIVREDCPSRPFNYAPDRFRGTVDAAGERFDSLNNDGAYDIDEPYMFRRVSCE